MTKINILAVCMWPWGGIRTYLKYVYHYFPRDQFEITLLANPTAEREHLERDMKNENIRIVWAKPFLGKNVLFLRTLGMLLKGKYDVIHSHGYISAFHVSLVGWLFRIPHVFTIHSILVKTYFEGRIGAMKRFLFKNSLKSVTVFHAVGSDILEYSRSLFPDLTRTRATWVAIPSGIMVERFTTDMGTERELLRSRIRCDKGTFLFGFVGRFQPEKGFNYIIDAVDILRKRKLDSGDLIVLAVGSGEYENEYKEEIDRRVLAGHFRFLPFDPAIEDIIKGCDTILMPSIIEGWSLLACEALCSGVPLIATDCLGLREIIEGTPAIRIRPHDDKALADAMLSCISNPGLKKEFAAYRIKAAGRFDARSSAQELGRLFKDEVARSKKTG